MVFSMLPAQVFATDDVGEEIIEQNPETELVEETTEPMEATEETAEVIEAETELMVLETVEPTQEATAPTEAEMVEETTLSTEETLMMEEIDLMLADAEDIDAIADNICGDNLTWTVEDGTLTISGTGPMYNFDGWGAAPWAELEISEVVISEGVTTIGDYAFNSCYYMDVDEIILPDGVQSIGEYAFAWTWIADISLPDSIVKIETGAFQGLGITSIALPAGIKTIEAYTFDCCTMLQSIVIPEGVTSIEKDAFYDCVSLTDIDFPDSLLSIGEDAFWSKGGTLDKFTIPKNIEYIGSRALGSPSCVIFEGRAPVFHETAFEYDTVIVYYPEDDTTWTADVMQDYGNSTITWVPYNGTLPMSGSLSEIANWEFDEQTETLTISGAGVIGGHDYVYSEDDFTVPWIHLIDQIKTVVVEEGISEIGQDLFYEHTSLETAKLPTTLHIICDRAFLGCISLNSVELPNNLATIGYGAFKGCTALENINIPDSVTNIGASAFERCVSLKNIVLPEGLTRINAETFYGCYDLVTVEIPDSVTGIDYGVFCECTSLKELILPANLTSIGSEAFCWCENLGSITIPTKVSSIGSYAFEGCECLIEIHFLGDVPEIGYGAFSNIKATISYPANNETWTSDVMQDYGGDIIWVPCCEEHIHEYGTDNRCVCGAIGGTCGENLTWALDDEAGTLTISGTGAMTNYMPELAPWYLNEDIKKIVIEDGVTSIGDNAFFWCYNVREIVIADSVESIGDNSFVGCLMREIHIPESVGYIGAGAFDYCEYLSEIVFYGNKPSLSFDNYQYIFALVYYPEKNDGWSDITENNYDGTINWVPYSPGESPWESVAGYGSCGTDLLWLLDQQGKLMISGSGEMTDFYAHWEDGEIQFYMVPWLDVTDVVIREINLEEGITSIGDYAFSSCDQVKEITIPDSVTRIGEYAFSFCSGLTRINIPENLENINPGTFSGCSSLSKIIIPGQIYGIGNSAFQNCTSLNEIEFTGHAPDFWGEETIFGGVIATAYYPSGFSSWNEYVMQDYGGNITWVPYDAVENRVLLDGVVLDELDTVWIDGVEMAIQEADGQRYVDLPDGNAKIMAAYEYHVSDASDIYTQYPVSMKVWTLENNNGFYTATRQTEFDNILQYAGSSIRVTGKKGIRMITAMDQEKKKDLTTDGLAGYTLKEYGTVIAWASQISENKPLVLGKSYVRSNYAYKKDVADPIFAYKEDKMQYTNVLVNFSDAQCSKDIAMRPYMILTDGENDITLYGGIVERSIGYIALQNKDTFTKGTEAYNYVWGIIKSVYGDVEE